MREEAQAEHAWLDNLVGTWTMKSEMVMGPDEPPHTSEGTEVVRKLGDLWVIGEMETTSETMADCTGKTILTLGYDPKQKAFVGTFIASIMTYLWIYERGTLDDAGKVLTLNANGPSFVSEGTVAYQDIIEIVDADHRILRSQVIDDNEVWHPFMTAHYYRQK
ncbi:DUF1579 domain-containing protein [Bremerella cremea]|uniref:DUF1579 domain-containing protein n=1 Tax=Bremerella cremea TaxID=1031537 RepID=UPI0031F0E45A